jgi:cytochrome c-type biogenesis protein CcmH/NrfG
MMPPMKPFFGSFLWLCLCLPLVAGCHDKAPSTELESSTPIVPPFASGLIEEPAAEKPAAHAGPSGGDVMAVIQQARERVNKNPKDLQALIFLGNANFDIQHYQEAEKLYRLALELDGENAQVRTDLATVLYRLGRPKEAVEELQRALVIDYRHENALYNLGMIKLEAFNDREGAISAWTQLKGETADQQLIAQLDALIAKAQAAPKPSAGSKGSTSTGTVLQLPASPKK